MVSTLEGLPVQHRTGRDMVRVIVNRIPDEGGKPILRASIYEGEPHYSDNAVGYLKANQYMIECKSREEAERVVEVYNRSPVTLMEALLIVRQPKPLNLYVDSPVNNTQ